jgi:hypothetical protein
MALIVCPTCLKETSSQAKSCPHCGQPMTGAVVAKGAEIKRRKKIFIPIIYLIAALWGYIYFTGPGAHLWDSFLWLFFGVGR